MSHLQAIVWMSFLALSACAGAPARPCREGGQPARENGAEFRGIKRCYQVPHPQTGKYVNEGKYFEWYNSDKIALTGQYEKGKKVGRWIEYDEKGNKISDKMFVDGKEVPKLEQESQ